MTNDAKLPVLIDYSNALVATGLRAALATQPDVQIIERTDLQCASKPERPPAAVIVAITDCQSGISLLTSSHSPQFRVLILTDNLGELAIRRVVELGVHGYLPLSSTVESVIGAVRSIHGGGTCIPQIVLKRIAMSLKCRALTEREIEVLRMIMQGLPDKAIARRLQRSIGTAKAHVKAILNKLEVSSRVAAVAVARKRGLVDDDSGVAPGRRTDFFDRTELLSLA